MFYAWDITIPAGQSESSPVTEILKLTEGLIRSIDVKYPAGCHGLVKVKLMRWDWQLVPLNRDSWLTGDDETVATETKYLIDDVPTELKFLGCAPSAKYDHVVSVRINLEREDVNPVKTLSDQLTSLFRRLGLM
jgi:hypothetical protein